MIANKKIKKSTCHIRGVYSLPPILALESESRHQKKKKKIMYFLSNWIKGEIDLKDIFKENKRVQYHWTILKRLQFKSLTWYHPPIQEYSQKHLSLKWGIHKIPFPWSYLKRFWIPVDTSNLKSRKKQQT